jgi:TM2 domain-containing membrane protein YozV
MVGTKYCSNCGEQIDERAEICPSCGVRQSGSVIYQEHIFQQKNPGVAAVLSALFVGLGQIYNGEIAKGLMFMVAYFVSIILIFLLIGFITTPLLWIFGIYDAYDTAKRINNGEKVV